MKHLATVSGQETKAKGGNTCVTDAEREGKRGARLI